MNTFYFFETHWKFIFYITSIISIKCRLCMRMKAIFFFGNTKAEMPLLPGFAPVFKPFFLSTRFTEKLHFHLFKLTHTEDKLAGYDLVAERLANLGDTKRYLHACRLLHVEEVNKYTLGCFGAQVNCIRLFGYGAELCREHQV